MEKRRQGAALQNVTAKAVLTVAACALESAAAWLLVLQYKCRNAGDLQKQNAFPTGTALLCCAGDRSLFPAGNEQNLVGRAQISDLAGY